MAPQSGPSRTRERLRSAVVPGQYFQIRGQSAVDPRQRAPSTVLLAQFRLCSERFAGSRSSAAAGLHRLASARYATRHSLSLFVLRTRIEQPDAAEIST